MIASSSLKRIWKRLLYRGLVRGAGMLASIARKADVPHLIVFSSDEAWSCSWSSSEPGRSRLNSNARKLILSWLTEQTWFGWTRSKISAR